MGVAGTVNEVTTRRAWAMDIAAQVAASAAVVAGTFRLWSDPWSSPLNYTGDALAQTAVAQQIAQTGWFISSSRQGAPTGFVSHDLPLGGDSLHYIVVKALGRMNDDPFWMVNSYYWLGFVLVAVTSFVVARWWGVRRLLAHPTGLLYAFAPYHLLRGTPHLTLSAYFAVPIGAALAWMVMSDRPPFVRRDDHGRWRWALRTQRTALTLMAVVIVGLSGGYYAVFTMVSLAVAMVIGASRHRRVLPIVAGPLVAVGIMAVLVAATIPSFAYWADNGTNSEAGRRYPAEQDTAPLRPVQLLTPVPGHRVAPLDAISDRLRLGAAEVEPTQFLGLAGSAGFVIALAGLVGAAAGRRPGRTITDPRLGFMVIALVAFGAFGSLGWITGPLGFSSIRAWGRISIVIAWWALMALAFTVQRWLERPRLARVPRWAAAGVAALTLIGLADQIPSGRDRTVYADALFQSDRRYFAEIESQVGPEAMIFQLPHVSYPEAPLVNGAAPQDFLRPLLLTEDVSWSFGAMRGRGSEWMSALSEEPPGDFVADLIAIGYRGILIDRPALSDEQRERAIVDEIGGKPFVSDNERYVFVDLAPKAGEVLAENGHGGLLARRDRALSYPTIRFPDALTGPFTPRILDARGEIELVSDMPFVGTMTIRYRGLLGGPANLTVTGPDGVSVTATDRPTPDGAGELTLNVSIGPGTNRFVVTTDAAAVPGSPSDGRVAIDSVTLTQRR
jgi:phosphoglycerol transferase